MKKGDLSRFVEEAVRWRVFDQTVQDVEDRNADIDPAALEAAIDDALSEVRDRSPATATDAASGRDRDTER
mgnify:CR=1 FL=1